MPSHDADSNPDRNQELEEETGGAPLLLPIEDSLDSA
jgi:hypothetical protein